MAGVVVDGLTAALHVILAPRRISVLSLQVDSPQESFGLPVEIAPRDKGE
jgi:hypothetical protein